MTIIRETKCTCKGCGNIWFYGKQDERDSTSNKLFNTGKNMMFCGGCLPALLIPDKKVVDLSKCPKCGSKAIIKEIIEHDV